MVSRVEDKADPSATLYFSAATAIAAPAAHVYDITRDLSTWSAWNTFARDARVTQAADGAARGGDASHAREQLQLGTQFLMRVRMHPADTRLAKATCRVSELSQASTGGDSGATRCSIAWAGEGLPRFLLRAERGTVIVDGAGGDRCHFSTWENQWGVLSRVVKYMYGEALQERFEDWARDLKEYAERTWREKQSGAEA